MLRDVLILIRTVGRAFLDVLDFFRLNLRSGSGLSAENLFLRKQLALYVERNKKPRRATDSVRFTLAQLSRFFEWRDALTIVKPDTDPVASKRFPIVLEMEISMQWPSTRSSRCSEVDRR